MLLPESSPMSDLAFSCDGAKSIRIFSLCYLPHLCNKVSTSPRNFGQSTIGHSGARCPCCFWFSVEFTDPKYVYELMGHFDKVQSLIEINPSSHVHDKAEVYGFSNFWSSISISLSFLSNSLNLFSIA